MGVTWDCCGRWWRIGDPCGVCLRSRHEEERPRPCLDPDKMLGASDQHSGHEYPGEYDED